MKRIILSSVTAVVALSLSAQVTDTQYHIMPELNKARARQTISVPDIMGYKTIKGDFHLHTVYSDGQVLPSVRVDEAWREGLDAIAITDHNGSLPERMNGDFNTSYKEAVSRAKSAGITLVRAVEYTDSKPVGHLNFLFIDEANQYARGVIEPKQAVEKAADKGAFVIYNHPGWPDCNSDLFDFQKDLIARGKIHGVEIFNGHEFYPQAVGYALNDHNLAPFSNTDAHAPITNSFEDSKIHRNLTLVFATDNSVEAIKEAMFARRTVAWAGNFLTGKREYLSAIMKGSLTTQRLTFDNSTFSCMVTNSSDITYVLDGPDYDRIILPAGKSVAVSGSLKSLSFNYKVTNLFCGTLENLDVPLGYIITDDKKQVEMPFVRQNITFFNPTTTIKAETFTPQAQIRYTTDGSEPTESSALYTDGLKFDKSVQLRMKAHKSGLEPSITFARQVIIETPQPALKVKPTKRGVMYDYYEGAISSVHHMQQKAKKVSSGEAPYFDLSLAKQDDYFAFDFYGFIYAPEDGIYTFTTRSDDGSVLIVDSAMIIDNDGSHGAQNVSGRVSLKRGFHSYNLKYMEDYEGQLLNLYWQKPSDKSMVEVPAEVLYVR